MASADSKNEMEVIYAKWVCSPRYFDIHNDS